MCLSWKTRSVTSCSSATVGILFRIRCEGRTLIGPIPLMSISSLSRQLGECFTSSIRAFQLDLANYKVTMGKNLPEAKNHELMGMLKDRMTKTKVMRVLGVMRAFLYTLEKGYKEFKTILLWLATVFIFLTLIFPCWTLSSGPYLWPQWGTQGQRTTWT